MNKQILLGHGSGGKLSQDLIKNLFVRYFDNPVLKMQTDAALLKVDSKHISFTTDSYVIDPIFFPGGNIGKLAVDGTINDLAVSGAIPLYLSASFIIEEGFHYNDLEKIVISMAEEAKQANVLIVTGDTKVVNKGKCDKVFINTAGIGFISEENLTISSGEQINIGNKIIINGTIGDHGMAVMTAREGVNISSNIISDSSPLNDLIQKCLKSTDGIRFMRDATRGGLATICCELVSGKNFGMKLYEEKIPVNEPVKGICELLGFDPLYVANEGKVVMVVSSDQADKVIDEMSKHPLGKQSAVIGEITEAHPGMTILETEIGGSRIVDMLAGEQLPRIC
ncbi:hydrogenase expression/formation protein HypE [Bacteroidota bacterium]